MEFTDLLAIAVPSLVSVIGFFISIRINRREYLQSIQLSKSEKQIGDYYGLQADVLRFVDMWLRGYAAKKMPEGWKDLKDSIFTKVITIGSDDAVKIIVDIEEVLSVSLEEQLDCPLSETVARYVLLAMQIKYDTTGVQTSPNAWYSGKFNTKFMVEAGDFYLSAIETNNYLVKKLKLKRFLYAEPVILDKEMIEKRFRRE